MKSHNKVKITNVTINNYFITKTIVQKKESRSHSLPKYRKKRLNSGFKLTDEKIAVQFESYQKEYEALEREKLIQKDFYTVCK